MVNPTTIYSSLQNIPFTTFIGIYNATTPINFPPLPPGRYEIKFAGTRVSTGSAVRQIQINETTVLDFQTTGHQETSFFINSSIATNIRLFNANATAGGNMSYQISYRRTPSLELLSLAELNQMNQELEHMQEIIKDNEILTDEQLDEIKQLHKKHTSIEQKRASKGVKNA